MNGISCETGDAVFIVIYFIPLVTILPAPIFSKWVIVWIRQPTKKKKKEAKKQRKLESKMVETHEADETENDPTLSTDNP